ncbi:hypothetical protein BQ8420_26415 [Nocardiopsis sp. JB363]|nr:hypothetical protein BQ8420_26415 [Nocardiopsis sp. JB363]
MALTPLTHLAPSRPRRSKPVETDPGRRRPDRSRAVRGGSYPWTTTARPIPPRSFPRQGRRGPRRAPRPGGTRGPRTGSPNCGPIRATTSPPERASGRTEFSARRSGFTRSPGRAGRPGSAHPHTPARSQSRSRRVRSPVRERGADTTAGRRCRVTNQG